MDLGIEGKYCKYEIIFKDETGKRNSVTFLTNNHNAIENDYKLFNLHYGVGNVILSRTHAVMKGGSIEDPITI